LFTLSNDVKEYAEFIYFVTQRIVEKRTIKADGSVKVELPDITLYIPSEATMKERYIEKHRQLFNQLLQQQDKEEAKRKRLQEERQESQMQMQSEKPQWEECAENEEESDQYQYKIKNNMKMKRKKVEGMDMTESDAEEEQDKSKRIFDPETVPAMKTEFREYMEYCNVDLIGDVEANTFYRIME